MASQNDDRDEDRDGVASFDSKAERARLFAAEMGLQAYALMAAAEGAVHAYNAITGEDWKPYEPPPSPAGSIRPASPRQPNSPPSGETPRRGRSQSGFRLPQR
jgi:hypothetical protein